MSTISGRSVSSESDGSNDVSNSFYKNSQKSGKNNLKASTGIRGMKPTKFQPGSVGSFGNHISLGGKSVNSISLELEGQKERRETQKFDFKEDMETKSSELERLKKPGVELRENERPEYSSEKAVKVEKDKDLDSERSEKFTKKRIERAIVVEMVSQQQLLEEEQNFRLHRVAYWKYAIGQAKLDIIEKHNSDNAEIMSHHEAWKRRVWNRYFVPERMWLLLCCVIATIISFTILELVSTPYDYSSFDAAGVTCHGSVQQEITADLLESTKILNTKQKVAFACSLSLKKFLFLFVNVTLFHKIFQTEGTKKFIRAEAICMIIHIPIIFASMMLLDVHPFRMWNLFFAGDSTAMHVLQIADACMLVLECYILPTVMYARVKIGDEKASYLMALFAFLCAGSVITSACLEAFGHHSSRTINQMLLVGLMVWTIIIIIDFPRQDLVRNMSYLTAIALLTYLMPYILQFTLVFSLVNAHDALSAFFGTLTYKVLAIILQTIWQYHLGKATRTDEENVEYCFPIFFAAVLFNDMIFLNTVQFSGTFFAIVIAISLWNILLYSGILMSWISRIMKQLSGQTAIDSAETIVNDFLYTVLNAEINMAACILSPLSLISGLCWEYAVTSWLDPQHKIFYPVFTSRLAQNPGLLIAGFVFVFFTGIIVFLINESLLHKRQMEVYLVSMLRYSLSRFSKGLVINVNERKVIFDTKGELMKWNPQLVSESPNKVFHMVLCLIKLQRFFRKTLKERKKKKRREKRYEKYQLVSHHEEASEKRKKGKKSDRMHASLLLSKKQNKTDAFT
eukprot:g4038.t1